MPSPVDAAWSWLANESGDLNRQVTADPRVVDATEAFTRCLADAGYDTTSYDEVFSPFSDRAARIGEEVRSGSLDLDTALVELDTLHAEELAAREAVDGPCLAPLQTVQGEVMAEMESAWLESNAPRLTELLSHLSDDVARLSAELDEIAEEES